MFTRTVRTEVHVGYASSTHIEFKNLRYRVQIVAFPVWKLAESTNTTWYRFTDQARLGLHPRVARSFKEAYPVRYIDIGIPEDSFRDLSIGGTWAHHLEASTIEDAIKEAHTIRDNHLKQARDLASISEDDFNFFFSYPDDSYETHSVVVPRKWL